MLRVVDAVSFRPMRGGMIGRTAMDRERFDAFTRLFASRGSRRAALGALLGA